MTEQRISKYLSRCGIASRRKSEAIVESGRVKVNGKVVTELSFKVTEADEITLDDIMLKIGSTHAYLLLNKPRGYLTTASDDRGRATVMSLIDIKGHRVFPIGRLDLDSEGLLLMTDDGDLSFALTHPGKNVDKEYLVSLSTPIKEENLQILRIGIMLDGILTSPAKVEKAHPSGLILRIVIHEGRKRQVRRMVEAAGSRVLSLKRTAMGPLKLGDLKPGEWRHLTVDELESLRRAAGVDL